MVPWPAEAPALADASECLAVPAATVGDIFSNANQLTFFATGDIVYQLAVKPLLPGDGCPTA